MIEAVCPYCNAPSPRIDYTLQWRDERFGDYHILRCRCCPFCFVWPIPTDEKLSALYQSIEYQSEDRRGGNPWEMSQIEIEAAVASESQFYLKWLPWLPPPGKFLDVGAGWGTLLRQFQQNGWRVQGLELSATECRFANERLGLVVDRLPVENVLELEDEDFDVIVLRHTLEHFRDPRRVLLDLKQKAAKGARFIIEVPDYGSYDRRAYGVKWPAFGPYHLWYFTRSSLKRLLSDCGLRLMRFQTFLSERCFSGSRYSRAIVIRLGGQKLFSGRTVGLVATVS